MESIAVFLLLAVLTAAVASVYDLWFGRIPNWLSLGVLAAAPAGHFALGTATHGLAAGLSACAWSIAGAAACGVIPWLCWRSGSFGGGDVKLLAAAGALCLPRIGMTVEFYSMVVGAIFAMGRLAWDGTLLRTLGNTVAIAVNPLLPERRRRKVPAEAMTPMRFAPAILGATVLCALSLFSFSPR
jgi:prepilin peptidase CpaA